MAPRVPRTRRGQTKFQGSKWGETETQKQSTSSGDPVFLNKGNSLHANEHLTEKREHILKSVGGTV